MSKVDQNSQPNHEFKRDSKGSSNDSNISTESKENGIDIPSPRQAWALKFCWGPYLDIPKHDPTKEVGKSPPLPPKFVGGLVTKSHSTHTYLGHEL